MTPEEYRRERGMESLGGCLLGLIMFCLFPASFALWVLEYQAQQKERNVR